MNNKNRTERLLGLFTGLTGVFALVGSLYSWGRGPLWSTPADEFTHLIITDLVLTAPISIAVAIGFLRHRRWARPLGVLTSMLYVYGSIVVYVTLGFGGPPYPLIHALPPLFGLGLAGALVAYGLRNFGWKPPNRVVAGRGPVWNR